MKKSLTTNKWCTMTKFDGESRNVCYRENRTGHSSRELCPVRVIMEAHYLRVYRGKCHYHGSGTVRVCHSTTCHSLCTSFTEKPSFAPFLVLSSSPRLFTIILRFSSRISTHLLMILRYHYYWPRPGHGPVFGIEVFKKLGPRLWVAGIFFTREYKNIFSQTWTRK